MDARSRGQRLAQLLTLPHRPVGVLPGSWFDVAFVLTISPFTGWVLGQLLIGVEPLPALGLLGALGGLHAAWLRTFPA